MLTNSDKCFKHIFPKLSSIITQERFNWFNSLYLKFVSSSLPIIQFSIFSTDSSSFMECYNFRSKEDFYLKFVYFVLNLHIFDGLIFVYLITDSTFLFTPLNFSKKSYMDINNSKLLKHATPEASEKIKALYIWITYSVSVQITMEITNIPDYHHCHTIYVWNDIIVMREWSVYRIRQEYIWFESINCYKKWN